MSTIDILHEIELLPQNAQDELLNYLDFLKFKYGQVSDDEYRELEKKVLTERYEKFKRGETKGIPYEETISKMKAKYGNL